MARSPNTAFIARLQQAIESGRYDRMEFLPSERQMAAEYQLGRGVIRNALKALIGMGLLSSIPGHGVCVASGKRSTGRPRFQRFMLHCPPSLVTPSQEVMKLLEGVCIEARECFAEVILSFGETAPQVTELMTGFRRGELQGILYMENVLNRAGYYRLLSSGMPAVVMNEEDGRTQVHSGAAFREIGRMAGQRLLATGRRRFGVMCGSLERHIYKELLAGFRGALAEEEVPLAAEDVLVTTEADGALVERRFRQGNFPEAFFTMRDYRAAHLYALASRHRLSIPKDLAVLSYDDVSWREAPLRGLTTIRQPAVEIGRAAVRMLRDWYATGNSPESVELPGTLVERSSLPPLEPTAGRKGR